MRLQTEGSTADSFRTLADFAAVRVHLIGIGGSGMSGAARMLLQLGAKVSGSDRVPFEGLGALVSCGARVHVGHSDQLLDRDVDLVVASAAIPETNAELIWARSHAIPVMKYAELVAALMQAHAKGIAIAGTHGKSTTTAMCIHLCRCAGLEPSFLVGATSEQLGGGGGLGNGHRFIVESCEFDRSFLKFAPESGVILNIDDDHLDCYRDLAEVADAFSEFAWNIAPTGLAVYNADDPLATQAARSARALTQAFGFGEDADWRALNLTSDHGCYSFVVQFRGAPVLTTRLSIPGRYNVANALAAIALAHHVGADFEALEEALPTFEGVRRRLTWRGQGRGVTIIDDYAHHPTEIRAALQAARGCYDPRRTWVVFQPHQHSRTQRLMQEFATSFADADEVIVPDVYGARAASDSADRDGSRELVDRLRQAGAHARYVSDLGIAAEKVMEGVEEGDLVLTMGAGDVWKVADELVERICEPDRV